MKTKMYISDRISINYSQNEKCFRKKVVQKIKTRFHIQYSYPENCAVFELMWRNIVEPDRTQMTIWRMRFACWMTKATDTHSQCVILNAFSLQKWLRERSSMLRYRPIYFACLVRVLVLANTLELPRKEGGFQSF
jgi:hypothetical protein